MHIPEMYILVYSRNVCTTVEMCILEYTCTTIEQRCTTIEMHILEYRRCTTIEMFVLEYIVHLYSRRTTTEMYILEMCISNCSAKGLFLGWLFMRISCQTCLTDCLLPDLSD